MKTIAILITVNGDGEVLKPTEAFATKQKAKDAMVSYIGREIEDAKAGGYEDDDIEFSFDDESGYLKYGTDSLNEYRYSIEELTLPTEE